MALPFVTLFLILLLFPIFRFASASINETSYISSDIESLDGAPIIDSTRTFELNTSTIQPYIPFETPVRTTAFGLINVVLTLIGMLSVLGIFICVPLGIYILVKKEEKPKQ